MIPGVFMTSLHSQVRREVGTGQLAVMEANVTAQCILTSTASEGPQLCSHRGSLFRNDSIAGKRSFADEPRAYGTIVSPVAVAIDRKSRSRVIRGTWTSRQL